MYSTKCPKCNHEMYDQRECSDCGFDWQDECNELKEKLKNKDKQWIKAIKHEILMTPKELNGIKRMVKEYEKIAKEKEVIK